MSKVDESQASNGTSSNWMSEFSTFNVENALNNLKIVKYSRTYMSIIGGVIAGVLGFTGWMGFVFYLVVMAITSVGLAAKAGFTVQSYFGRRNQIILDGFLGGLLIFVLFWTFSYDAVHIF